MLCYTVLYCTYVCSTYMQYCCALTIVFFLTSVLLPVHNHPCCTLMHSLTSSFTQPCDNDIPQHARVRTRPTTRARSTILSGAGKLLVTLFMRLLVTFSLSQAHQTTGRGYTAYQSSTNSMADAHCSCSLLNPHARLALIPSPSFPPPSQSLRLHNPIPEPSPTQARPINNALRGAASGS